MLGADHLPLLIEHLPVVDDQVSPPSCLVPLAHRGVAEWLLESKLCSTSDVAHAPNLGVLGDPGVEDHHLGLVEIIPVATDLVPGNHESLLVAVGAVLLELVGDSLAI